MLRDRWTGIPRDGVSPNFIAEPYTCPALHACSPWQSGESAMSMAYPVDLAPSTIGKILSPWNVAGNRVGSKTAIFTRDFNPGAIFANV